MAPNVTGKLKPQRRKQERPSGVLIEIIRGDGMRHTPPLLWYTAPQYLPGLWRSPLTPMFKELSLCAALALSYSQSC